MVLDTNILIAYLDGDLRVVEAINARSAHGLALFISAVSYAEILSLPEAGAADLIKMRNFLNNFILVDVNKELAEISAEIKRQYKFKFADSAIVATARLMAVSLVTRDKQLWKAKGVNLVEI